MYVSNKYGKTFIYSEINIVKQLNILPVDKYGKIFKYSACYILVKHLYILSE